MILDTNVWSGHWHKKKFDTDTPKKIHRHIQDSGISMAMVSSTDAVFCSDPEIWNKELMRRLKKYPLFIPVPVFKPTLANWEKVINQYSSLPVRVLRLLPNYHGYSLISKELEPVFQLCSERNFVIFIQMRIEDEREHHPMAKVPPVKVDEVIKISKRFPDISFVSLSSYFSEAVNICSKTENVYVDISFVERMDTVKSLLEKVPASRVLFGSHTPFFYTKAALMRVEYAEIRQERKELILFKNACKLLNVSFQ